MPICNAFSSRAVSVSLFLAFFLLGFAFPAVADVLLLENGDRITGILLRVEDGKAVVDTGYAGEISIDFSKVVSLETPEGNPLYLKDKSTVANATAITRTEDGALAVIRDDQEEARLDADQLAAVNTDPFGWKFNGKIEAGVAATSGNTDTESAVFTSRVDARKEKNRFRTYIEANRAKDNDELSEKNWLVNGSYDRFLTEKLFLNADALLEYDYFQDIALRQTYGPGLGYNFFDDDINRLILVAGPSYVLVRYRDDTPSEDFWAARWDIEASRWFFDKKIQLFHFQNGRQSLEDSDTLIWKTRTGISYRIWSELLLSFTYTWDWNGNPADDAGKVDRGYVGTLGVTF